MSSRSRSAQTLLCLPQATLPRLHPQTLPLHHRLETCLLENVTSSQGNLGSFIAEKADEVAANLWTRKRGEGELEQKEVECALSTNQF